MFQVLLCQERDKTRRKQNKPKDEREKMKKFLLNHKNNRREEAVGDAPKTERKENFHSFSPSEVWRRKLNCCCCYPTRNNRFTWNPNKYIILKTHADFTSTACNSHVALHFAASHEEQRITIATMITRALFMHPQTLGRFRETKLGLATTKHPKREGFLWG